VNLIILEKILRLGGTKGATKNIIYGLVFDFLIFLYRNFCFVKSTPGADFTKLYFVRKAFGDFFILNFRTNFHPKVT
jgi:hypothetical protein